MPKHNAVDNTSRRVCDSLLDSIDPRLFELQVDDGENMISSNLQHPVDGPEHSLQTETTHSSPSRFDDPGVPILRQY